MHSSHGRPTQDMLCRRKTRLLSTCVLPSPTDFSGPLVLSEPATLREECSNALLDEVATNSYRRCKDCLQPKVADRRNGTLGLLTCAGCVALPRFSCILRGMRGTATLFAQLGPPALSACDVWIEETRSGGPSGVRTLDLGIKSPLLCQLS